MGMAEGERNGGKIKGKGEMVGLLIKGGCKKGLFIAVGPYGAFRVNALTPFTITHISNSFFPFFNPLGVEIEALPLDREL